MERIQEKELMDAIEHAKAYDEADFSEPHNAFVSCFKERFPYFSSGKVIDLGCGTADVSIRFSKDYPEIFLIGIDGAQAMLDIGIKNVNKHCLSNRITFLKCRIPDDRLCKTKFDAVISNSLLHHLYDPLILWQCIIHCAKQGAPIFVMDLLRPENDKKALAFVKQYTADASPILQKDFYNSLLASYNVEEIKQQLNKSGLDYLSTEVVSDRHVLVWGIKNR